MYKRQGLDRVVLAFLSNAYEEEQLEGGDVRTVMHFHPAIAPFKAAVLPLQKKLGESAQALQAKLAKRFAVDYDDAGSIGKRYRRQDEAGTPFCITVDFDTAEDNCVTVRDRDTMEQVRMPMDELEAYLDQKCAF